MRVYTPLSNRRGAGGEAIHLRRTWCKGDGLAEGDGLAGGEVGGCLAVGCRAAEHEREAAVGRSVLGYKVRAQLLLVVVAQLAAGVVVAVGVVGGQVVLCAAVGHERVVGIGDAVVRVDVLFGRCGGLARRCVLHYFGDERHQPHLVGCNQMGLAAGAEAHLAVEVDEEIVVAMLHSHDAVLLVGSHIVGLSGGAGHGLVVGSMRLAVGYELVDGLGQVVAVLIVGEQAVVGIVGAGHMAFEIALPHVSHQLFVAAERGHDEVVVVGTPRVVAVAPAGRTLAADDSMALLVGARIGEVGLLLLVLYGHLQQVGIAAVGFELRVVLRDEVEVADAMSHSAVARCAGPALLAAVALGGHHVEVLAPEVHAGVVRCGIAQLVGGIAVGVEQAAVELGVLRYARPLLQSHCFAYEAVGQPRRVVIGLRVERIERQCGAIDAVGCFYRLVGDVASTAVGAAGIEALLEGCYPLVATLQRAAAQVDAVVQVDRRHLAGLP